MSLVFFVQPQPGVNLSFLLDLQLTGCSIMVGCPLIIRVIKLTQNSLSRCLCFDPVSVVVLSACLVCECCSVCVRWAITVGGRCFDVPGWVVFSMCCVSQKKNIMSEERRIGGCAGRGELLWGGIGGQSGCYNDVAKPLGIWFRLNSIFWIFIFCCLVVMKKLVKIRDGWLS